MSGKFPVQNSATPSGGAVVQTSNWRPNGVLTKYAAHSLIAGRTFFTLPMALLTLIQRGLQTSFDPQLFTMDLELSEAIGDHGYQVGYRDRLPIGYHLLGARRPIDSSLWPTGPGSTWAGERAAEFQLINERLEAFGLPVRGYAGWLLTNPEFLSEHDAVLAAQRADIRKYGFPRPVLFTTGTVPASPEVRRRQSNQVLRFADFCQKWRLQTLAAEYLPLPFEPQLPTPWSMPGMGSSQGCTTAMIFDIHPVVGRGEVPAVLEDGARGEPAPVHLKEWIDLVRATNPSRIRIQRFARLFQYQHYMRVLYGRHASQLARKKTALSAVFAEFFDVSIDVIRRDERFLVQRLGSKWHLKPSPLDVESR